MTGTAEIADLNQAQCLQLLGADGLGRVVFTTASMPAVTPVCYHLDGDEVIFRAVPLQQLTGHRVTLGHVGGNLATPHAGSPVATP